MPPGIKRRCGMAETTERTADEILLEDILNALDITFDDDATKKKIWDIMQQGRARLEQLKGGTIDFAAEQTARTLLFSFCRYGRSNAIEQFEHDFSSQIVSFALEAAVANVPESGAADESKV